MTKPFFVFIVDSYANSDLLSALESIGLVRGETYDQVSYYYAGRLMVGEPGQRYIDAAHLLVFMSTFGGNLKGSVVFSEEIKKENPTATIIFRSTLLYGAEEHKVFDRCLKKNIKDYTELLTIIQEFIQKTTTAMK